MKELNNNNNNNVKEYSWDNNYGEGDLVGGFLWPPRSYTCSFCKREFRSAQALGGHMNVHRRDRARLRLQSSPPRENNNNNNGTTTHYSPLNLEPNPNPNPSFISPSSPSRKFPIFVSTLPPLISPQFSSSSTEIKNGDLTKMGSAKFEGNGSFMQGKECSEVVKRAEFLRLDLGIGLISESKDDLDLELRLGYI
ncbi:hypothetical protein RND71_022668 [Anisodus tanguticus]|uniref:C2H2-type domain-containing protein n=1 Tax=Anisodus tanguticus TaxID=243964 RepID=A0AAE1RSH8_9SOLA|nr:hypothetical protein RND71_022668 [Anisodus tanguticus]